MYNYHLIMFHYLKSTMKCGEVLRFNELIRNIGIISPKSLSQRLKELINFGIVAKQQYNEIPPRVEYFLTESGKDLTTIFKELEAWGKKWGKKQDPLD